MVPIHEMDNGFEFQGSLICLAPLCLGANTSWLKRDMGHVGRGRWQQKGAILRPLQHVCLWHPWDWGVVLLAPRDLLPQWLKLGSLSHPPPTASSTAPG